MDIELWLVAVLAGVAFGLWGWERWKAITADGKITLDEIVAAVREAAPMAQDVKEKVEDAVDGEEE
tara:strand:- start:985 stop:1182 length:198 start_codon:yes stop_codon:yes gene_type:complete